MRYGLHSLERTELVFYWARCLTARRAARKCRCARPWVFGKAYELVGAAIYLASNAASFVTGQILVVEGGILGSGVNQ